MEDRPAIGGLLLWEDEQHYLRLERGYFGQRDILFRGEINGEGTIVGRGLLSGTAEDSERIHLRLERSGDRTRAFCSADGEHWYTVGTVTFPAHDSVQVGVHAIGNIDRSVYHGAYPEGTAICFESFQMWQMCD
jgi:regulation of enolase protein 1 (concanavalin A-like superfamily)